MLIPIRCFTCNKVLANKWNMFKELSENEDVQNSEKSKDSHLQNFEAGFKGKVLDKIGVTKLCCRRHMLTHVDLIDLI